MSYIDIKKTTAADLPALHAIARQTFYESFAHQNTPEDMQRYLEENLSMQKLTREWNHPDSVFYLAQFDQETIGYLKINYGQAQTEIVSNQSVEIERIYVSSGFQGRKVGQLLFETAMDAARQLKADYLWLGVWEHNTKAIQFYKRNGFVEFGKHPFRLGEDIQTDLLMRIRINNV